MARIFSPVGLKVQELVLFSSLKKQALFQGKCMFSEFGLAWVHLKEKVLPLHS